jgi:hypothetical protein
MAIGQSSLSEFTDAYITAALWSSTDDQDNALDSGEYELSKETKAAMRADCMAFYIANEALISAENYKRQDNSAVCRAGHDFWLTRCGHGAGFWDGDWHEPAATKLTEACKAYGNVDLYIGDDGLIYQG